jgi:hypothetical protein
MSIGYTWEKLYGAVRALAQSDGTLEDRLASAYRAMHMLTPEDFPDEDLRNDYTTLVHAWRLGEHQRRNAPVAPAPAVLPADQARALAEKLLRLYTDITRLEEQHYRSFSTRHL